MSTPTPTLGKIAQLYTDSLEQHGTVAKGVGWGNEDDHRLRFEKLTEILQPAGDAFSVNDLGCGYGSLFTFLKERGLPVREYRGCDISEKMLEAARAQINDPAAEFLNSTKLDRMADYSFASGIFNVRFEENEDKWRDYIFATLRNMHEFSGRGFAFNLLTCYVDWKEPHLYYADPCFFFDFCKKNFSRKISLLHDTRLWEWTMIVRK